MLTQEQAQAIVEAHEVDLAAEEGELLKAHNPELYDAYEELLKIAAGEDE